MKRKAGTIPEATQARIESALPRILSEYGTPCFVFDEQGILDRGRELKMAMRHVEGYKQFFAVKAWPTIANLRLQQSMGFGDDCSSPYELHLMDLIGAGGMDVMFTSNNSRLEWFEQVQAIGGIVNLDDISFLGKFGKRNFPELISFRMNPGRRKTGSGLKTFSKPYQQKYGIRWDQMVAAYSGARSYGARSFGMHMMVASNCLDEGYLVDNARLGFKAIAVVEKALGIHFEFYNMGGGFGIPYKPSDKALNINRIGERLAEVQAGFRKEHGYAPKLFTEMGRWMTGPYGVLVVKAVNVMDKYQKYVGVDAGMEALARPAFYGSHHHIEVVGGEGRPLERVSIVGSICENWDRLTEKARLLPIIRVGDTLMVANCGAHAGAMGFNYNGQRRVQEVMLKMDGTTELIRRAEMFDDLDATLVSNQGR